MFHNVYKNIKEKYKQITQKDETNQMESSPSEETQSEIKNNEFESDDMFLSEDMLKELEKINNHQDLSENEVSEGIDELSENEVSEGIDELSENEVSEGIEDFNGYEISEVLENLEGYFDEESAEDKKSEEILIPIPIEEKSTSNEVEIFASKYKGKLIEIMDILLVGDSQTKYLDRQINGPHKISKILLFDAAVKELGKVIEDEKDYHVFLSSGAELDEQLYSSIPEGFYNEWNSYYERKWKIENKKR